MSTHSHDIDFKEAFTVTDGEQSEVIITGEIPFSELEKARSAAIKKLGKDVELDGFRKGHVPEDILVKHVGEAAILSEMAERTLAHIYPHILEAHKIDAIGYPQINVTKLAPGNPFAFTATVAVLPEITLPDYKALAATTNKGKEEAEVTDADIDKQVEEIMRKKMSYDRLQANAAKEAEAKDNETDNLESATELPTPESEAKKDEAEFDPETAPLPELTDDYVKELGQPGQFTDVTDFKAKVREHLEIEKKREVDANHRAKLTDTIIDASTLTLPKVLIDSELNQMFAQMQEDLTKAGLKFEDYLGHIKKSKEDLEKEWAPAAEKRAKLQLILNEIAKQEEITPDEKAVAEQVTQLKEQHKDADEARVRVYVESVLTNEAVLKMLENL